MNDIELSIGGLAIAFAAGFVSFTSPCVLPLVPGYLSFVSGVGFDQLGARTSRVVALTGAFVVGFTIMFVLLGAGAAWFGNVLLSHRRELDIAGGILLIVAALVIAGLRLPRVLLAERRLNVAARRGGPFSALLTGVVFAVAWTPCIGPTLAAILTLSAAGALGGSGDATDGAILLAFYSLGLGVPFLLFGLLFTRALGFTAFVRRNWRAVTLTSAALLFAFGVLLITGDFTRLMTKLSTYTGWQL